MVFVFLFNFKLNLKIIRLLSIKLIIFKYFIFIKYQKIKKSINYFYHLKKVEYFKFFI